MPFRRLPRQSRQLMAYVLAGGLTAVAHYGVLVGLVELAQVDPVPATLAGFGLIAVGGFGLTWVLMHLFVTRLGLPYLPMQFVTTGFVMVFSFLGHKFFSFADRAG
jgi:putative flippase GtrA